MHNRNISQARKQTTDEDRKKSLRKLQKALQKREMVDETSDPLAIIKAYKYAFVRELQGLMGGAIIRRTTESKTNEGKSITDLPPKVVTQFIVRLSNEEHALLNKELYHAGEETERSLEISFEVSVVYVGLPGRRTDVLSHTEFFGQISLAAQRSPSRHSRQKGHRCYLAYLHVGRRFRSSRGLQNESAHNVTQIPLLA